MFGFSSRPIPLEDSVVNDVPVYASLADAEAAMKLLQAQIHALGMADGYRENFSVVFSCGMSLPVLSEQPEFFQILELLEARLQFNVRHCRRFILQNSSLERLEDREGRE